MKYSAWSTLVSLLCQEFKECKLGKEAEYILNFLVNVPIDFLVQHHLGQQFWEVTNLPILEP